MINVLELTDSDVGREVIYRAPHGAEENGWISSWNEKNIWVRFGTGQTGQNCPASTLRFAQKVIGDIFKSY